MKTQRQFLSVAWLAAYALLLLSGCRGPAPIAGGVTEITAAGVTSNTPLPASTPLPSGAAPTRAVVTERTPTPTVLVPPTQSPRRVDTATPTAPVTNTPATTKPVDKTPVPPSTPVVGPTQEANRTISQIMQTELPVDGKQVKPELSKGSNVVPDETPVWKNEKGEIVYMYDKLSKQIMYTSVSSDGKLVWFTDTDMRYGWYDVSEVDPAKFQILMSAYTDVLRMYKQSVPAEQNPPYMNPNGEEVDMKNRSFVIKLANAKDWETYLKNTGGDLGFKNQNDYDPQMLVQAGKPIPDGLKGVLYRHIMQGKYGNFQENVTIVLEVTEKEVTARVFHPNDGIRRQSYDISQPENLLEFILSSTAYHKSNPATPNASSFVRFDKQKK